MKLENATLDDARHAPSKVVISKDETTIVEGAGSQDAIKGRIEQIKRADREDRLRLGQARSCRSGWPSSPAASP